MKVHPVSKAANDMRAMVEIAVPAGPCTPGFTQVLATTCDKTGEAYGTPDWVDPVELEQSVSIVEGRTERAARAGKYGGCGGHGGPAIDVVAVFNAGKDAFKEGVLFGMDLARPGHIVRLPTQEEKDEIKKSMQKAIDAQDKFNVSLQTVIGSTVKNVETK